MRLAPGWTRLLKTVHIILSSAWLASAMILVFFFAAVVPGASRADLHGILIALKAIDDWVIIPAANGILITGIMYGALTHWGWFKHGWITAKWGITLYGILFGTFLLGPRLNRLPELAVSVPIDIPLPAEFTAGLAFLQVWGSVQLATLLAAYLLSVYRWKRKGSFPPAHRAASDPA
ncbi:MAG: hypothetical protein WDA72_04940 [Desulfomonilia bacterium]|jgi:uncharacterized membrane protein|nr:hypothetical protein [Deltaproteobacteria bacterium]MDX9760748.1 hypothetical protein [Desulfomonilia bacterium]HPW68587.1 hypothetical protein [Deltaproteobacteria bacterium]